MKKFALLTLGFLLAFLVPTLEQGQQSTLPVVTEYAFYLTPFHGISTLAPVSYGQVRVCSLPLTQTTPCLPIAAINDPNTGSPLATTIPTGGFGQLTTDVTGKYSFACAVGNYFVQAAVGGNNTPSAQYTVSCPQGGGASTVTGAIQDKGGQLFNVRAYGALGVPADDTAAYNSAANACNQNGGGTIFFPPGQYNLTSPNSPNPGVFGGQSYKVCSIAGAGASNTRIILFTQGFTLSNQLIAAPFYAGDVSGIQFELANLPASAYALRVLDSVGWNIHECQFNNVNSVVGVIPVLYEINNKWCERNHISNSQFWGNNPSVKILFDPATVGDFAYNVFENNHFNQPTGDIFFATGTSGGGVLGNRFEGQANFTPAVSTNSNWFHITGSGNKLNNNYFNVRHENDGAGTTAIFCVDPGVTVVAGTGLSGYVMDESGGMIGCTGGQAVSTNLDVWGRGFYAGQNGLYFGSTVTSATGAPTPVGRITGGTSNPGACDNGVGADPAGSIFTNNSITGSGANGTTIWGCIGQNYQPFVLRQGASDLTGQTANVGTTTVATATASGMFRLSCYTVITTPATTSSTLPVCTAAWTDADNSVAQQSNATLTGSGCTPSQTTNTTATNCNATWVFNAKTGTNIQYFTSGYASVGGTALAYSVHVRVEPL